MSTVFASSLLSLMSPWGRSRAAPYLPSPARWPRQVAPPPPPRRHSVPTTTTITPKHRRYSDHKNPKSKLDLRQELINLNLNNQEVDTWLGNEFDEKDEDDRFVSHDVTLQRSISLDGGIEVFNYLQTVGSDWSGSSVASSWTLHSDRDRLIEQYRSFEDIPASQIRMKSRRASSDFDSALGRSLAVSVLKDSYSIDMGSGSISPQIKKLQRTFSFKNAFEDTKSVGNSTENLENTDGDRDSKVGFYRNTMFDTKPSQEEGMERERQRKTGAHGILFFQTNLRKEVLKRQNYLNVKSCENLSVPKLKARRGSTDDKNSVGYSQFNDNYNKIDNSRNTLNILKLKNFSRSSSVIEENQQAIVVTNYESSSSVAKKENTSNVVDLSRNCDCRICREDDSTDSNKTSIKNCDCKICRTNVGSTKTSYLNRILTKLFIKIVSARKLICWDENNNYNESEMYNCLMQVLKLLFGLWLRHFDHN